MKYRNAFFHSGHGAFELHQTAGAAGGDQVRLQVDDLFGVLYDFAASGAMPVVFHLQRDGYSYQLRTNGGWSLRPDERCLLELQRHLDISAFHFEYP